MQSYAQRALALILAIACLIGTGALLFEDLIWHGAPVTTAHLTTAIALLVTIAAGHLVPSEARARRMLATLGLVLIFAAGTLYVVSKSSARTAEAMAAKVAQATNSNENRAQVARDLIKAVDSYEADAKAARLECASGVGPKCNGLMLIRDKSESHMRLLKAKLELMAPKIEPETDLRYLGQLVAATGLARAEAVETFARLSIPLALTLIMEIGALVFASIATRKQGGNHRKPSGNQPERPAIARKPSHPVLAALENVGKPVSNRQLAELLGCSEGEASKSWREVQKSLSVSKHGRELRIELSRGYLH